MSAGCGNPAYNPSMKPRGWLACAALLIPLANAQTAPPGYAEPGVCATCHQAEAETYRKTGMGRSFYTPKPEHFPAASTFYHKPSDTYFEMVERNGKYFQRQ